MMSRFQGRGWNWSIGILCVAGLVVFGARTSRSTEIKSLASIVEAALQDASPAGAGAVQELRAIGPEAVSYLIAHNELHTSPRWSTVLDTVAQQRDAQFSGLYWYTDLEQAMQAARREQKPILSLRLLGNLTDELSCANSRFFRTTLYPQQEVRDLLSAKFVLHWQPVRSVPIITIDFGDGRKIQRTITGNSAHLILDPMGRPIDLLPGLYGAGEFVRELNAIGTLATALSGLNDEEFRNQRMAYHAQRLQQLEQSLKDDCAKANVTSPAALGTELDATVWSALAAQYFAESVPRATAAAAVASKVPAEFANLRTMSKSVAETPMLRLVRNIGNSISEDTVRNKYHLHARLHRWMSDVGAPTDRDQLVQRAYAELFLTPLSDPWYGLSRPDQFSAITKDGRIDATKPNSGD